MSQGVDERLRSSSGESASARPAIVPPGVEVQYCGDHPTISLHGRVERLKVAEVSGTIRGLLAVGVRDLTVDLTDAWDGAALLPVLARTRTQLSDNGGSLRMVGVALPEFLAALTTAALDEVFLVYEAVRQDTDRRTRDGSAAEGDPALR
jgi:hypothetical protein